LHGGRESSQWHTTHGASQVVAGYCHHISGLRVVLELHSKPLVGVGAAMATAFAPTAQGSVKACSDPTCSRSSPFQPGLRRQQPAQLRLLRQQRTASRSALRAAASAVAAAKAPAVETKKQKGTTSLSPEVAEDLYRCPWWICFSKIGIAGLFVQQNKSCSADHCTK